jgi:cytochrome c6
MQKLVFKTNCFLVVSYIVLAVLCPHAGADTTGSAERGAQIFKANCAGCHPGGGNNIKPRAVLYGEHFAREFADDARIASVVRNGKPPMPAFSTDQISDQDLADVIAYIRTLTPPQ